MVKKFFLLLVFVCLFGCANGYFLPEGGLRPKNYKHKDYSKYEYKKKELENIKIDTSAIYVSVSTLYIKNGTKQFIPIDTLEKKWVYRFYGDGKYSYFNIYNKSISKSDLKPTSGTMGFYGIKYNNRVEAIRFVKTPGGDVFRKKLLIFSNDTLYRIDTDKYLYTIFLRKKVPNEWLNVNADW